MPIPTRQQLNANLTGIASTADEGRQRFLLPAGGIDLGAGLASVLGVNELFPSDLQVNGLRLTSLFVKPAGNGAVEEVGFELAGHTGSWTLVPDFLELENRPWALSARITAQTFSAALSTSFSLGNALVSAELTLPEPTLSASVTSANKDTGLFDRFLNDGFEFLNGSPIQGLTIESVSFLGVLTPRFHSFSLAISDVADFGQDVPIRIDGVELNVALVGGNQGSVSLSLAANATFAGSTFRVEGAYGGRGQGWTVGGKLTGLSISRAMQALGITAALPEFLRDLTVSRTEISFHTKTRDFSFGFEIASSSMPFGSEATGLTVTCEARRQGSGYRRSFSGSLIVDDLEFDLIVQDEVNVKTAVALFRDPNGVTVTVGDLIRNLTNDAEAAAIANNLTLTINEAVFGFLGATGGSRFVFGIDLGSGLDLSNLPLVGGVFPRDEKMELAFRLAVTSGNVDPGELAVLNRTIEQQGLAALPAPASGGRFAVAGRLKLGAVNVDLAQPLLPAAAGAAGGGEASTGAELPVKAGSEPAEGIQWVNIQREFGPVRFERAGVAFAQGQVKLALDASISAAGLTLTLDGLSVSSPLTRLDPTFDLRGIGVSFRKQPIEITGTFLRTTIDGREEFAGLAVIRAKAFSITALGAFAPGAEPSMFVFAVLDKPLGGPSCFFVTGLAAGFGYNRDLLVPPIAGVAAFPLVKAAKGTLALTDRKSALASLVEPVPLIPPRAGAYWLAAGIKFESFKIIDSIALLVVKFGNDLEINLLGVATLQLPKKPAEPYVYVEMAFKVAVRPAEGLVSAEARLTENSYVIDKSCRLAGGFAFYAWFDGLHKGDFVVTLGGYHPRFAVPAHYPRVPRLELTWTMEKVSIKGQAYFALTPSCVMAGGSLEVAYRDGSVEASLTARADFLISWKPFFYVVDVFVSIRAALVLDTLFGTSRLGASLSASVHIEGPEFRGIAEVTWTVVSFTVRFGATNEPAPKALAMSFAEFRQTYLPADADICKIRIASGLVREHTATGGAKQWVVRPEELVLLTETAIPATQIMLGGGDTPDIAAKQTEAIGIRTMATGPLRSTHTVSVRKLVGGSPITERVEDLRNQWIFERNGRRQAVPKELWDTSTDLSLPTQPSAEVVPNCLAGIGGLRPGLKGLSAGNPPALPLLAFAFAEIVRFDLPIQNTEPLTGEIVVAGFPSANTSGGAYAVIRSTVFAGGVRDARRAVVLLAEAAGFRDLTDDPMGTLAVEADTALQFEPMLGGLGSPGVQAPRTIAEVERLEEPVPAAVVAALLRLLAEIFQWEPVGTDAQRGDAATSGIVDRLDPGEVEQEMKDEALSSPRSLITGQSLVWDFAAGDDPLRLSLRLDGDADVRIVAFDQFGRLVQDDRTAPAPKVPLDPEASRIVTMALPRVAATQSVAGWRAGSSLAQVRRRTFLAENASVRMEAALSAHQPGRPEVQLTTGEFALSDNIVESREETSTVRRSGSFRTNLPDTVQTIAVYLKPGDADAAPALGTLIEAVRENGERLHLLPSYVVRDNETGTQEDTEFVLLCQAPTGLRREAPGRVSFRVRASGATKWQIRGVVGIDAPVFDVRLNLSRFRLKPQVLADPASKATVRVSFVAEGVAA
jgi:hypothetical protein